MQSYSNSFWEDVVLDSFNMAYSNEDFILDQIFSDFYYEDLKFKSDWEKMHI